MGNTLRHITAEQFVCEKDTMVVKRKSYLKVKVTTILTENNIGISALLF